MGETVQIIEAAGGTAIAVECDVAEPADLVRLLSTAVDTFGGVDVVVNNAADMVGQDFEKLLEAMLGKHPAADHPDVATPNPFDNWLRQFATNVHGPHLLITLATPHLRANGGVIVNITSDAAELVPLEEALKGPPANPSLGYAVTKAALNRLTNAVAANLAADRIAVIAVDPGVVHTEVRDILDEGGIHLPLDGAPMSVPVATVLDIVTSDDPMTYSGRIIRAQP